MYNKDNIEGIVFQVKPNFIYKVIKINGGGNTCHLKKLNDDWEDDYYDLEDIFTYLNNGRWAVIKEPSKIYECW